MTDKKLKRISYLYLIIPIIIFMLGWVKLIIASLATIVLLLIVNVIFKQTNKENDVIIEYKKIIPIFIFLLIICIAGGHGGLFYQSEDWDARNAIFRDLINYEWPVYYEQTDSALTYYIGQWMVPSLFGKLAGAFFNADIAFQVGNIALLFWDAFGVLLAILWLIKILNVKTKGKIWIGIIIFLFFSGLDIIGMGLFNSFYLMFNNLHLEWWATEYQFSSMITQLFWVFNQSIPIWLVVMMFLEEKRVNNYCVLVLIALPFSPIPVVGFAILCACNGIKFLIEAIKQKELKSFLKDVFSVQNILAIASILPIYATYYFGNASAEGGGFSFRTELINLQGIVCLLDFWLFEVGIYGIFLLKNHLKDPLYWVIMISLLIIPLFQLGYDYDFAMRASIPALLIVDVWIVKFYIDKINVKNFDLEFKAITIILCIGLVTPMCEFYRAFYNVAKEQKINVVCDNIKTLATGEISSNFVTVNPKENSIFFKSIAKDIEKQK